MKKVLSILTLLFVVAACDETIDPTIYGGTESDRTFLSFSTNVYDLNVIINDTGTTNVILNSSTVSSVDRTYAVSIVEEETTAAADTYVLPATITIPAGEHQGVMVVQGIDNGLGSDSTNLVIEFTPINPATEDFDSNRAVISIMRVCPIEANMFTGAYLMEQISAINPDDGVPVFNTQVVNITATSETARRFSAVYLQGLGIGQPASTVNFNLSCGNVVTGAGINGFLLCVQGGPTITLGPGAVPGVFDAGDDSSFTLTMTEYVTDGGCGSAPFQVTFQFTKQ